MRKHYFIFSILSISAFFLSCAQEREAFLAVPESYVIDENKGIIVLNIDAVKDSLMSVKSIVLNKTYLFKDAKVLSPNDSYQITSEGKDYTLFVTKSPILSVTVKDSLVSDLKKAAVFKYFDSDTSFTSAVGMRLRGNLSLSYPKKSYNVEFYEDAVSESKKDVKFKKLYNDDDWILDGLYNEPLLLNSYVSQKLWKDIHPLTYASEEPKAKSTVDGIFVDLFINNEYTGVYLLSEKVSRTLLKLKKFDENTVEGELFKAESYLPGTSFTSASEYKNSLPRWNGFEMEYPYEDYVAHWDDLYKSIDFIETSSDTNFENNLQSYFEITTAIDYFLFVNAIRATDNLGKNYYLARYAKNTPYFFVPWDMDGTFGTILDGRRINTTDDILSNHLFDRLLKSDTYRIKIQSRWNDLRKEVLSNTSILARIESKFNKLKQTKFYERDELIWDKSHDESHLIYTKEWLLKRMEFLDEYFNKK